MKLELRDSAVLVADREPEILKIKKFKRTALLNCQSSDFEKFHTNCGNVKFGKSQYSFTFFKCFFDGV